MQIINFTEPFYAPPVLLVTPKRSDNSNNANLSGSRCNAVASWVEVSITLQEDWAHSFYWRGLSTVFLPWLQIKCVYVCCCCSVFVFCFGCVLFCFWRHEIGSYRPSIN